MPLSSCQGAAACVGLPRRSSSIGRNQEWESWRSLETKRNDAHASNIVADTVGKGLYRHHRTICCAERHSMVSDGCL